MKHLFLVALMAFLVFALTGSHARVDARVLEPIPVEQEMATFCAGYPCDWLGTENADFIDLSQVPAGFERICTLGGDDTVYSLGSVGGWLTVCMGDGNDRIDVYSPMAVYGGTGNDRIMIGTGGLGFCGDAFYGEEGDDVMIAFNSEGIYNLYGGPGDDKLMSLDSDSQIYPSSFSDHLYGGSGNDILCTVSSFDSLYGEEDHDILGATSRTMPYNNGGSGKDGCRNPNGIDCEYFTVPLSICYDWQQW